jgi:hypothetical protein
MDFTQMLGAPETDVVDTYTVAITVPAVETALNESAFEVTTVKVSLTKVRQTQPSDGLVEGDILATVTLRGYPLTRQGRRYQGIGLSPVYAISDEEARWEIARQALLASCDRHHLDATHVVDHSIATWAEHQAASQQSWIVKDFGLTTTPESKES